MENNENTNINSISLVTVVSIIFSLIIISVGSSRFLASREKPAQTTNSIQLQKAEYVDLEPTSSSLFGNYRGVLTILNPQIKFSSSMLILSPNGRFTLQADSFSLSTFKNDQLKVNNDYPYLYFDIEGSFVREEGKIKLSFDKANYRFDQEEISLNEIETAKTEEALKTLGISFESLKKLPLDVDLTINPNKDFLDLGSTGSNLLLQIQVRKI